MEEKLDKLYKECVEELKTININIINNPLIGKIDIKMAKRNSKRYGCCRQEKPNKNFYHIKMRKNRKIKIYERFSEHHIEISKWVMELEDKIIKNTIMHEIIHCFPNCNNHGTNFKNYSNLINQKLGYNIKRLGNREEDYKKSNIEFEAEIKKYKYKIICKECGQVFLRQRLQKNFTRKYRCGKCRRRVEIKYRIKEKNFIIKSR